MQHVVSQLISKKEELSGELKFYKTKVQQLEEIISGIDTSIKVFSPDFDIKKIKAKRYTGNKHYFKRGESHVMILDTLRKAKEPMTTSDITIELMRKKKLDHEDRALMDNVQKSLLNTLKKQVKSNLIQSVNKNSLTGFTWELVA
ncbi:MAG: hypothetical protein PHQ22_10245 [Sulfuricurvum sp.]|nr:hypothetical protein [Sulfuricurvum sp.]MDD5387560.1 hypothetical protein [Sulfuricurvum sp.]